MRASFISIKLIAIIILMALFWIGLFFISGLVSERQGYQQAFLKDIAQNNISPQIIISPYIRVPYQEQGACLNEKNEQYACTLDRFALIGADSAGWTAEFNVSDRAYKRTIYRAVSYQADLSAQGVFQKPEISGQQYQWDKAEIVLPVHDPRGLDNNPSIKILNKSYQFEMSPQGSAGSGFDFMAISVQQRPELLSAIQNGFKFNLQVNSAGLGKFTLIPTSRQVTYAARGNWADAKYDGQSLPYEKTSSRQRFTAQWKNIALGQQNLNKLASCSSNDCIRQLGNADASHEAAYSSEGRAEKTGLSTEFLEPVNAYTQTDRALKYGIAIILITFGCFFLFEVLKGLRIHPVQYSLVAVAQGIFFVLLLSISEYYAFAWAYAAAAAACVSLMTWYLCFVMNGIKAAALFGTILSALYAVMYLLLQSSGKTFLIGSVISFIALAAVMFLTRHVDWYQLSSRPERGPEPDAPPQP